MRFERTTLGQLSIGGKGNYGIAASAVPYSENLLTYLRITDISDQGTLKKDSLMSVADANAEKYLLKPNDIVFARTGNSTGRNYFYDGSDGNFVYAGFLIRFSLDRKKVNPRYIKYYCQSAQYWDWVQSFNTGSTRGNINAQTYANMEILLPAREQQDFLVRVLSPIDEKIRLNQKINENLNPTKLSAVRSFYRILLNPRKRLKTLGFKQVNHSFPLIRSHPLLRASRELAREKSREDIGFWNVKDKASVGCRDVTSQQTCTLYQPKTSYKTRKRTSEDARFFVLWR